MFPGEEKRDQTKSTPAVLMTKKNIKQLTRLLMQEGIFVDLIEHRSQC
jgi:hypothetical protein